MGKNNKTFLILILIFLMMSYCSSPESIEGSQDYQGEGAEPSFNELIESGRSLYEINEFEKANKYFSLAARRYDTSATARAWYALNLGRIAGLYDGNKGAKYGARAYSEMNKALEIDSKNPMARMARGQNYLYAPAPYNNYGLAINDFIFVSEIDTLNEEALFLLSMAYQKNGNNAKAIEAFDRLKEYFPDSPFLTKKDEIFN